METFFLRRERRKKISTEKLGVEPKCWMEVCITAKCNNNAKFNTHRKCNINAKFNTHCKCNINAKCNTVEPR